MTDPQRGRAVLQGVRGTPAGVVHCNNTSTNMRHGWVYAKSLNAALKHQQTAAQTRHIHSSLPVSAAAQL